MEVVGADRIQQRPDMVVAGDPVQAEQRLAIRAPLALLQTALMRQKGRALHEEQGKRRHVRHRVAHITSLPEVRQRLTAPAQRRDQTIQNFHDAEQQDFRRRGNPPKAPRSNFPPAGGALDHSRDSVSVGFRTAGTASGPDTFCPFWSIIPEPISSDPWQSMENQPFPTLSVISDRSELSGIGITPANFASTARA